MRALFGISLLVLFSLTFEAEGTKTALLVVGGGKLPLWADKVYKNRLEKAGFRVSLISDADVTQEACEAHDIALVSASISGGVLGTKLNDCSTPQMIWESRTWQKNGMAKEGEEAYRVTSAYFNKYHENSWTADQVPPPPTGPNIVITAEGAKSPLAGGKSGVVEFWTEDDYGMNYVPASWLGEGAKVVANLPYSPELKLPEETHATLFYYEKGAQLYGNMGLSAGFRIGWPQFSFLYGGNPSCEEAAGIACDACHENCYTAAELMANGQAPTPLTYEGLCILDAAIEFLASKASTGHGGQQQQQQQQQQSAGLVERHIAGLPDGADGAAFIQLPRTEM